MPKLNVSCPNYFALVPRSNCNISKQAYNVQIAHYEALIMYNHKGKAPFTMQGGWYADKVQIPVVMVNYDCMVSLSGHYSAEKGLVNFYLFYDIFYLILDML